MGRRRRSSSSGGGSVKHSIDFFEAKYNEFVNYSMEKGIENPYHSLNQFISDYEELREDGSKNVMKDIKYFAQHEVSYNTARAMLQKVKEYGGPEKFKELKDMKTQEFAEKYLDKLKAAQKEAYTMYGNSINPKTGKYERIEYIGVMWFGSE